MAEAYRHIGASDRADALFSQAVALAGLPRELRVEIELEQADLWRATGRLEEASRRLVQLIEQLEAAPTTPNALASAYNNYGLVLEVLERPEQAESWIRRALVRSLGTAARGAVCARQPAGSRFAQRWGALQQSLR